MDRLARRIALLLAVTVLTVVPGGGPSRELQAECEGIFDESIGQVAPDIGFEWLAGTGTCARLDEWHAGWADIRVLSQLGVFGRAVRASGVTGP